MVQDEHGAWWPDKNRGFSIRLRKLPDVAEALSQALDLAEEHQRQRQPGRQGPHGMQDDRSHQWTQERTSGAHSGSRSWRQSELPEVRPGGDEFDEFKAG
jgi:hypothetical protein